MQGTREYALTVVPGQRQPLHAGAASKMLIAHLPKDELDAILGEGELFRYTAKTVADRKRLCGRARADPPRGLVARTAANIRRRSCAYAAPIRDRNGKVVAALSVPFLQGSSPDHMEVIRVAVIAVAGAIAADLPPAQPSGPAAFRAAATAQSKNALSSSAR